LLISRGLDALARAAALGPKGGDVGPYVLQAALAVCHARRSARQPSAGPLPADELYSHTRLDARKAALERLDDASKVTPVPKRNHGR
jgi:predicted RNA polymerase sigma factor